jgi:hypothetical protein
VFYIYTYVYIHNTYIHNVYIYDIHIYNKLKDINFGVFYFLFGYAIEPFVDYLEIVCTTSLLLVKKPHTAGTGNRWVKDDNKKRDKYKISEVDGSCGLIE